MNSNRVTPVDVEENAIFELHKDLLTGLLKDHTTGKNIIWATDDYNNLGEGYYSYEEILPEHITGNSGNMIMPRAVKSHMKQVARTRNMAEVFTPTWICNKMNNLVDAVWFKDSSAFNVERGTSWTTILDKIVFNNSQNKAKDWIKYISSKRLEITCGEAPYLVSRYDAVTGELLDVKNRIGVLDRKLRIINEKVRMLKDRKKAHNRWLSLVKMALQSTYGFEWQGDNVLLARENILYSVADYFYDKFRENIPEVWLEDLVDIISWNIWQMDGIKCVIPNSCHDYQQQPKISEPNLFDKKAYSSSVLKRSVSPCDIKNDEIQKCQGCLKDDIDLHNGIYCKIKNWSTGRIIVFKDLWSNQEREDSMDMNFKFDVVIGNPPYQAESTEVSSKSNNQKPVKNVFQYFQQQANSIAKDMTCLIYPGGRWIHRFGKGLQDFGYEQINDSKLDKIIFYPDASDIFDRVQIADGITVVLKKMSKKSNTFKYEYIKGHSITSIDVENPGYNLLPLDPRDISICGKIDEFVQKNNLQFLHDAILPRSLFRIESDFVEKNPDKVLAYKVNMEYDKNKYIKLFTNDKAGKMGRATWFLAAKNVITSNFEYVKQWQVVVSSANAGGQKRDNQIEVIDNNSAFGRSRVALRSFVTEQEARNFYKYANTYLIKYAFLMTDESLTSLGKKVPDLMDYSDNNSMLDFHGDLDIQLYSLCGLDNEDIAHIEKKVNSIRAK